MRVLKKVLSIAVAAALFALGCASRSSLCSGPAECAKLSSCVAGQCLRDGAIPAISASRRFVLPPEAFAVLEPGEPSFGGALPAWVTLGRANDRGVMLLLSFDLHLAKIRSVLRASVLLDRSDAFASDAVPISLHAEAVIGRWDARKVRSSTVPPLEDVRSPRTVVWPSGRRVVRVDVTTMAQHWLSGDPAFQGLAIVAENTSPTGVTFAMRTASLPELDARGVVPSGREVLARGPRLELYVQ